MPKLTEAGTTRKISIHQIIITGNVRADYTDIEELAASIKKNTLLEPILVKLAEPDGDDPRYELIAGHRRLAAHHWLCEHGDDFSMIEAKIITGDKLTIQLVENLQRADLSPRDREKAIFLMSEVPGVSQRDIAAELSKTEVYVSRQISAYRVRSIAEAAGENTEGLETSVMSEIQTAAEKDIPMLIGYIKIEGGTVAAAKKVMGNYRPGKKAAPPSYTPPPDPVTGMPHGEPAPEPAADVRDPLSETDKTPPGETVTPEGKKDKPSKNRGEAIKAENPDAWKRGEVIHKEVDLNDVLNEIYSYLTALETKIRELGLSAGVITNEAEIEGYKKEAALDILSLVQKRFGD